jgi:probable HAF family extracellular repeat protein
LEDAVKRFILPACLFLLAPIAAAQTYTVTDLGPVTPTAINIWAQVVGSNNGQAFVWSKSQGMRNLGTMPGGTFSMAAGINDLGVVTGTADGPGTVTSLISSFSSQSCSDLTQPFVWSPTAGMQGLGTVAGPENSPWDFEILGFWCEFPFYATGINDRGEVVGYTGPAPDLYQYAFRWTSAGGMTTFGSGFTPTFANGANNSAQVVGQSEGEIGNAAYWKNGVMTTLADLGAGAGLDYTSSANGVNDLGQVVGWATTIPFSPNCDVDLMICPIHAVLWTAGGTIQDLGTLPGDTLSTASKINLFGQVIGSSGNSIAYQQPGATGGAGFDDSVPVTVIGSPFIWTAHSGMRDLNSLIPSSSGWVLNSVSDLNIWGQIVGEGTLNGQTHGFLLTPRSLVQF